MEFDLYVVDSFAERAGEGNPAGVVFYDSVAVPIQAGAMQLIAAEIGKSETAFITGKDGKYFIRWFSPVKEMPLCGHATLAAAKVLAEKYWETGTIVFKYPGGSLDIRRDGGGYFTMGFPVDPYDRIQADPVFKEFFGDIEILECIRGQKTGKTILIVPSRTDLRSIKPDFSLMRKSTGNFTHGIGISKKGEKYDFESRYFNPWAGVDEDPVTGSVHTVLAGYWSRVLDTNRLTAFQDSRRRGILSLEVKGDRLEIRGKAVIIIEGKINI